MRAHIGFAITLSLLATPALAAAGYKIVPQISDQPGVAPVQDTDLVNPWGLAQLNDGAPVWTSDNGSDKSTFYDRNSGAKQTPVVQISPGAPTGIVAVPNGINFEVSEGGTTGRCYFIFDTETGVISCWAPSVDDFNALVGYDGSGKGAVYKGLAIDAANQHLFTADFARNRVEIVDTNWTQVGSFTDPDLPKHYAPFNVAVLNGKLYVAFAKHGSGIDEKHGKGLGLVDVFDLSGNFQTRLISGGALNAPWGLAIAPSSFGTFSNDLLVGNFGDGHINVYDPNTGAPLGTLSNKQGKPLKIDGLWALDPGPGTKQVQFSAGPDDESHGLIGLIKAN